MKTIFLLMMSSFSACQAHENNSSDLMDSHLTALISFFKKSAEGNPPKVVPEWVGDIEFRVIGFTSGKHTILPDEDESLCDFKIKTKREDSSEKITIFRFTISPPIEFNGGVKEKLDLRRLLIERKVTQLLVREVKIEGKTKSSKNVVLVVRPKK